MSKSFSVLPGNERHAARFSPFALAPNYGRIYGQKYMMSVKKFEPSRRSHAGAARLWRYYWDYA